MKYLSIDIETTGLNPLANQVLEVGAYVEDTNCQETRENLPVFHHYVWYDNYVCEPYAAAMNSEIFKTIIALKRDDPDELLVTPDELTSNLHYFLRTHFENEKVLFAGKNIGSFDLRFLSLLPGWNAIKAHHRHLDPTLHFVNWSKDQCPPDLTTCKQRAGIAGSVTHHALDDAWDVIELLRFIQCQKQSR